MRSCRARSGLASARCSMTRIIVPTPMPSQILRFQLHHFDGVLAFGEVIRKIYLDGFGVARAWTFHEAADISVFHPMECAKQNDLVWIGNWGDEERTQELMEFLVAPAIDLIAERPAGTGARRSLSRGGEEGVAALRNRLRGLSSQPERAGGLCAQPPGAACAAPPVCQRTERGADDPRL